MTTHTRSLPALIEFRSFEAMLFGFLLLFISFILFHRRCEGEAKPHPTTKDIRHMVWRLEHTFLESDPQF